MAPATPTSAQWVNETPRGSLSHAKVLTLKHLHRSHTSFRLPKSPGRRREPCCAARPHSSPFSSQVCGDVPDSLRPLSSHQFSPLGDLPSWDFEILTLGGGGGDGVSESIRGCGPHCPPPRAWDRATLEDGKKTVVVVGSPAACRVTCPSPRRGPEEIEILPCTQRQRSPYATTGGFARDTWLLRPTERVP